MRVLFAELIVQLKRELDEDRGMVPTSGRPSCPDCARPLVAAWGRNTRRYRIICSGPMSCPRRLNQLAIGETEEEAWAELKAIA